MVLSYDAVLEKTNIFGEKYLTIILNKHIIQSVNS